MTRINKAFGLDNPLQDVFPKPILAQRAPTSNDKQYPLGQNWIDQPNEEVHELVKVASGVATWVLTASGTTDVETLTGDTGGPISPTAGNINILGGDLLTIDGSGNTLTINRDEGGYPVTPYVVGISGEAGYTTIQSAADAANSAGGGIVYVQPGTYTEDLTLYDDVQIVSLGLPPTGGGVDIVGSHTPPITGKFVFRNCKLSGNPAVFSSAAAGNTHLIVANCSISVTNSFLFDLVNWTGILEMWDVDEITFGASDGCINNTGGAPVLFFNGSYGAGTLNSMVVSGIIVANGAEFFCPINFQSGSSLGIEHCVFYEQADIRDNSDGNITNSIFRSGASPPFSMNSSASFELSNCTIDSSNNPAISGSGAGTLTLTGIDFVDNSDIAGTLTLAGGTSKSGSIEAFDGNVSLTGAATQLQMEGGGVTDFIGQATLVAGTVTVANTNIAAADKIVVTREGVGASTALGILNVSITATTSFTITALQTSTPASTETNDVSIVNYFIVREL